MLILLLQCESYPVQQKRNIPFQVRRPILYSSKPAGDRRARGTPKKFKIDINILVRVGIHPQPPKIFVDLRLLVLLEYMEQRIQFGHILPRPEAIKIK